jgi:drug/metabolite transporter (DMT)-like permease
MSTANYEIAENRIPPIH